MSKAAPVRRQCVVAFQTTENGLAALNAVAKANRLTRAKLIRLCLKEGLLLLLDCGQLKRPPQPGASK